MTDIFDIKNNLLGFPINITFSAIYIFLIIIYYFALKKFFEMKKIEKKPELIQKKQETPEINFLNELNNIKQSYIESETNIFYFKLWELFRLFLEKKYKKNISKLTFRELQKVQIDFAEKELFWQIYFKEFMQKFEDNKENREELIEKIRIIIS